MQRQFWARLFILTGPGRLITASWCTNRCGSGWPVTGMPAQYVLNLYWQIIEHTHDYRHPFLYSVHPCPEPLPIPGSQSKSRPRKTSFRRSKRRVSRWNLTALSRKPYPDPWPERVAKDSTGCWTRWNGVIRTDIIPLVEVFKHRFKKALYRTRGCCSFCIKVLSA